MSEIKIGDRVRIVEGTASNRHHEGRTGTVMTRRSAVRYGYDYAYSVHLDGEPSARFVSAYTVEHITPETPDPIDPARTSAAYNAKTILGDTADVFDIVTLAEFLLGKDAE